MKYINSCVLLEAFSYCFCRNFLTSNALSSPSVWLAEFMSLLKVAQVIAFWKPESCINWYAFNAPVWSPPCRTHIFHLKWSHNTSETKKICPNQWCMLLREWARISLSWPLGPAMQSTELHQLCDICSSNTTTKACSQIPTRTNIATFECNNSPVSTYWPTSKICLRFDLFEKKSSITLHEAVMSWLYVCALGTTSSTVFISSYKAQAFSAWSGTKARCLIKIITLS